mgnify:CR=1 FL=1
MTEPAPSTASHDGRWTDQAVDAVCGRFAPFWPLDAMVATNPYLGFVGQTFSATAEYHRRVVGRPMTMRRDWFREQIAAGRITDADLANRVTIVGGDFERALDVLLALDLAEIDGIGRRVVRVKRILRLVRRERREVHEVADQAA